MSREKGRIVRCFNVADGVQCARVAEFIGAPAVLAPDAYTCESCTQGNKPYVPRDGRSGQQKQTKRAK